MATADSSRWLLKPTGSQTRSPAHSAVAVDVDAIVTDAVVAVLCHLVDDLIFQFWLEPQALTGDHAETNLPQVLNLPRKPVEVMLQEPRLGQSPSAQRASR